MVYTEEKHDNKCLRNTLKGFNTTEQNIDTCLTELFRDVTDDLVSSDYFWTIVSLYRSFFYLDIDILMTLRKGHI